MLMYKRIRDLREDSDLTQTQLAWILHCSQQICSRYERSAINVPTDILIKLADYHNTSIDYILGRTDVKAPLPPAAHKTNK